MPEDDLDDLVGLASGPAASAPPPSRKMFVPREAEPEAFSVRDDRPAPAQIAPTAIDRSRPEVFSVSAAAAFVLLMVLNTVVDYNAVKASLVTQFGAAMGDALPKPYLMLGVDFVLAMVGLLLVFAPLTMGVWRMACRLTNARPPNPLYVRALGLSAVLYGLARGFGMLASDETRLEATALAVLVGPAVCFGLLIYVHKQVFRSAAATAGLLLLITLVAGLVLGQVTSIVSAPLNSQWQSQLLAAKQKLTDSGQVAASPGDKKAAQASNQPSQNQIEINAGNRLTVALNQLAAALSNPDSTRQTAAPLFDETNAAYTDLKSKAPGSPLLSGLDDKLADYQKTIDAMPSSTPPTDLNVAVHPSADWSAPVLSGSPVTIYGYDIVLPPGVKCDFTSTDADGYKWDNHGTATLLITRTAAAQADQQRPWLTVKSSASPESKPYRIDARNGSPVSCGTIGGVTFTRVAPAESNGQVVVYAGRVSGDWLTCTLTAPPGSEEGKSLDYALKTLQPHPASVAAIPPIQASDLLDRWSTGGDQPQLAQRIASLPNAEDSILVAAGGAAPGPQFARMLPLLAQVATEKSLPLLWKAYETHVQVSDVLPLLSKLDPIRADPATLAMHDLKAQPPQNVVASLTALATAKTGAASATDVGQALSDALDEPTVTATAAQSDALETALLKWSSPDANHKLGKYLDDQNSPAEMRHVAMHVLSQTHDKRYAFPICRWLEKDKREARDALIVLGPTAEADVIKMLTLSNTEAHIAAAQVLSKIGTRKSIYALQTSLQNDRDPDFKDQVKVSMDEIKQRVNTAPAPASASAAAK